MIEPIPSLPLMARLDIASNRLKPIGSYYSIRYAWKKTYQLIKWIPDRHLGRPRRELVGTFRSVRECVEAAERLAGIGDD